MENNGKLNDARVGVCAGMENQGKKRLSRDQRVSFICPANRSEDRKLNLVPPVYTDTSGNPKLYLLNFRRTFASCSACIEKIDW